MRIRAEHSIGDLTADLTKASKETGPQMRGVVRDGLKIGTNLAKGFAKRDAGPHGQDFYKRITSQMNRDGGLFGNTISGEYGPTGVPRTEFIGVGFRHGGNTDLPRSADIVGPSFLRSVDDEVGDIFRRAGFK